MLQFYKYFYKKLFIIGPVLIGLSALLQVILPAESDKGWLLHAARMWLEGNRLYVDIIEINPPLIIWLYALPEWVCMHVRGLHDYEVLGAIGLVCCAFSVYLGARLIRLHPAFESDAVKRQEFTLLLAAIFIFFTSQAYFFDREHIFLVLAFPYMLRFMPSLADRKLPLSLRIVIAGMAGVGCCVKPHTLIVFAALQLFAVIRAKSIVAVFHLENYIVAIIFIIYLGLICFIHPEYFLHIVPMAAATYADFGHKSFSSFYLPPAFIAMALIFADFRPWHATPFRRDIFYWVGIWLAFLVYALSNNGWGYTYNPLYSVLTFIAVWMLWHYNWLRHEFAGEEDALRRIRLGMRSCALVLALHTAWMVVYIMVWGANAHNLRSSCEEGNMQCVHKPYIQYLTRHNIHSFGTLSYDFNDWVAITHLTDIRWDTRFNHLWMMQDLLFKGPEFMATHRWILNFVAQGFADDLNRKKPEVVFVDVSPGFMGRLQTVTFPAALSAVPEFKEAWSHYHYTMTFDTCKTGSQMQLCKYNLYSRIP